MSYILDPFGIPVAETETPRKSGERVRYAFFRAAESVNASREWNLVNANAGRISNAKKWQNARGLDLATAEEINPGEFYIR